MRPSAPTPRASISTPRWTRRSARPGRLRTAPAGRVEPRFQCRPLHARRRSGPRHARPGRGEDEDEPAESRPAPGASPAAGRARIVVSDNGQGIAPEFLPHVFDRFRQWETPTTRKYGGLGAGLSIVKHLVELHGGTVTARSGGPGEGATFVVLLPRRPRRRARRTPAPPRRPRRCRHRGRRRGRSRSSARRRRWRACACWWSTTRKTPASCSGCC